MIHNPLVIAALSAGLLAPMASGMYAKNSPVIQLDSKNFAQKILKSNHASIVEFYAPWCGHCKNLKPAYEAAASNLNGLANVAAIDCDDAKNKATCSEYGIQGFPTLKTFRPGKKPGKPIVEDYNGPRAAKGIVDWVLDRIPNHVTRLNSKTIGDFMTQGNDTAKAILFTTKGVATPLYKALAVDFYGAITFAQVRDKEKEVVEIFGVEKFPTLIVLPGGAREGAVYDGDMKKEAMYKFLSKFAEPTEGKAAPKGEKEEKEPKKETSTTSAAPPKPTFDATIADIPSVETLVETCFSPKSKTCMLVFTPAVAVPLTSFEEANAYLHTVNPKNFPFFQIPLSVVPPGLKEGLAIPDEDGPFLRAVNGKRGWWKGYEGDKNNGEEMRNWVDAIRLGEFSKEKLPNFGGEAAPEAPKHEEL